MNYEVERMWKEPVLTFLKFPSCNFPEEHEGDHRKPITQTIFGGQESNLEAPK
jgi:hypothetical protein